MTTESPAALLEALVAKANAIADGHLTIMKFTTNWRVGFGTPSDRWDIDDLWVGATFDEAAAAALAGGMPESTRERRIAEFEAAIK